MIITFNFLHSLHSYDFPWCLLKYHKMTCLSLLTELTTYFVILDNETQSINFCLTSLGTSSHTCKKNKLKRKDGILVNQSFQSFLLKFKYEIDFLFSFLRNHADRKCSYKNNDDFWIFYTRFYFIINFKDVISWLLLQS